MRILGLWDKLRQRRAQPRRLDPRFRYRRCATCRTPNRVPAHRFRDRALCGACGKRLPVP